MYRVHTNEIIEWVVNMYISCNVSLLPNPLQNAQHQHSCKKKNKVVHKFQYLLPPMRKTFFFKPLQIDGNYPFS